MIDENKIAVLRGYMENRPGRIPCGLSQAEEYDLLDTLTAALHVVRAAQELRKDSPNPLISLGAALDEALKPFNTPSPGGKEA